MRIVTLRISILFALSVSALIMLAIVFGPVLAPWPAEQQDLVHSFSGPSARHWLGTDELGRDILSRLIIGARAAVLGPVIVALGAMAWGAGIAMIATYHGGMGESLIVFWIDLMSSVPHLLIAIVALGMLSGSYWDAIFIMIVLLAPGDARIIRNATRQQRNLAYVEALRVAGVPALRIIFRHIFPSVVPQGLVQASANFTTGIIMLSSLSFLGFGVPPGAADWGRMMVEGRLVIGQNPCCMLGAGLAIACTATSVSILSDWLGSYLSTKMGGAHAR
ncbi:ABC transporter permease [Komagataeibacter xylinus]|uniref:ABC transporter permease n=1 Tax=Komagataeibacter xylinus TaxID=28448 RepID=A0A857FPK1_KOMXY|nr:ABC transporter permease [Komagataeibacter xylinus]QHC35167.1 ABC transporter permease [Komagataeibacter xylinus]